MMNLPNKLTVLRIAMVPVFLAAFYFTALPWNFFWAFVIFTLASFTDLLDGQIARRRGLVTDFGKFMDPLADKILVMSALICLAEYRLIPGWVAVLVLARELAVTGLRTVAAGAGVVIAADKWGKLKTVFQMIWICYDLTALWLLTDLFAGAPPSGGLLLFFYNLARVPFGSGAAAGLWTGTALWVVHMIFMCAVVLFTLLSGYNYLWKNRALFKNR